MKRLFCACGLFGALLLATGCGQSKPAKPSWVLGDGNKGNPVAKNSPEQLQRDLASKIKGLEKKMAALEEAIASVERSKHEIVAELHAKGVRSLEDLGKDQFKDDEKVKRLKDALVRNRRENAKYQQMRVEYSAALFDGNLARESLERQLKLAKAGITEKELEDLALTIRRIDRIEERGKAAEENPVDLINGDGLIEKDLKQ